MQFMFKKLISMATAVLLMSSGVSVLGSTSASANNSQANLSMTNSSTSQPIAGFDTANLEHSFPVNSQIFRPRPSAVAPATILEMRFNGVVSTNNNENFTLNVGANTYTVTVRSQDQSLTRVYVFNYTFTPPPAPVITSSSTVTAGLANQSIVIQSDQTSFSLAQDALLSSFNGYLVNVGTTGLVRGGSTVTNGQQTLTLAFTGTASAGTITFQIAALGSGRPASNTLSFVVGGSTPAPSTPEQIAAAAAAQAAAAAAAAAAAQAAAVARAAEIATAQTSLATVLRGDKAGSLSEYRAANINITTTAALTRLNAEVLKLPAADRADFAKIKAIADKIEFDETFFNATARPSLATYSSYGVTGVTERILPVINAKVLELPAALRADVKAMQELVKVESFVDRVANPATRSSVSAAVLVSRGLLNAENPRRHSIVNGLARYPEGSLNTMAKIEAAIKEQIFIAEAPKRRLAEIKARMAARKK
jgi:hypothetical protein